MMSKRSAIEQNHRREFLKYTLGGTACIATLANPLAASAKSGIRTLNMRNLHTSEHLKIAYWVNGRLLEENLSRLNFFLRDHRQNEATLMDVRLFDQLWELQQLLGPNTKFEIISAYRSPKTNAMLRANSRNVAQKSYHIRGRALDIRAYGTSTAQLRKAARTLKAGGVGYYPRSKFVHIDTGPVRSWRS